MKKHTILLLFLIISSSCLSQSIYKGLNYGMSQSEAKKEFKQNKTDYTTIDIGNGFLYRIYRQNFIYDNGKLVGVVLNPKGSALGMSYDLTRNYLTNPLVLHELDGNLYESKDLRKFQSEYIATTLEVGRLGFNMVFTVRLTKGKSKTEI